MTTGTNTRLTCSLFAAALAIAAPGCDDGGVGGVDSGPSPGVDAGPGGGMDAGPPAPGTDGGPTPGTDGGPTPGTDGGPTPTGDGGGMPTRDGAVGSACTMDGDCTEPSGSTCMTTVGSGGFAYEFPGGYCTMEGCTAGSGSAECGAGAECYSAGFGGIGGTTFCAKTCTSDADCRTDDGYTCQTPPLGGGTTKYCLPPQDFGGGDGGFGFP